ncbi:MAG: cupin domain-containing protein [Ferruginibacter sp.]
MEPINLLKKFNLFTDQWSPKVIGELNGQAVKLAKVKGEFVWHDHKNEDELFFVVKGKLKIEFRDKVVELGVGEMLIVPKGVEHKPIAEEETWIMLFEPVVTKHTGEVRRELTVDEYEKI